RDAQFLQRPVESGRRCPLLQGVPEAVDAAWKASPGLREALGQPLELAVFLEGRVDQHDAALLLRRQVRAERQPAVETGDAALEIAVEQPVQRFIIVRM